MSNWKNPQIYLIIIREWPKNSPPHHPIILKNLDNFSPGTFYLTPSPSTIRHERVATYILHTKMTQHFLNDQKSIRELFSGIGSLKGVKVAVCGSKCIDLTTEAINKN